LLSTHKHSPKTQRGVTQSGSNGSADSDADGDGDTLAPEDFEREDDALIVGEDDADGIGQITLLQSSGTQSPSSSSQTAHELVGSQGWPALHGI